MTISRRDFLKMSGMFAAWTALSSCAPNAAQTLVPSTPTLAPTLPPAPLEDDALIVHTLRRMSFGATPAMFEKARRIGLEAYIEEQLAPESIPDAATEKMMEQFTTLEMTAGERFKLDKRGLPVQELIAATILRQWHSERQLFETMVDFWSDHFNIFIGKSACRALKTDDDLKVIRPNALAKFRDLLYASAHSPAMLVYLDQADSRAEAPNENYARELMELHTIGASAGYSQQDVMEVARVLTGWSITGLRKRRQDFGSFYFNPETHDNGEKHALDITIPPGGENEGMMILDLLASHPSAAQFISRKLARRFISDSPTQGMVDSLAQVFTQTDGDIRALLRALLTSDEFKASAGQKFKRPLDFFISMLRLTDATITSNARSARRVQEYLRLLGQVPFTWSPPNGFPESQNYWATTSGLLDRWNFSNLLVSNQIRGVEVNLDALTADAASAEDIVDVLSLRFLGELLPDDARSIIVDFASSGNFDEDLPSIAGLILGSPHFQMR
ncbi:MAG: DUF1800 family protein [Anaerolineales bacterium]|nr:MAG: DUF1800 family protein [Anaerolineales bacterium]